MNSPLKLSVSVLMNFLVSRLAQLKERPLLHFPRLSINELERGVLSEYLLLNQVWFAILVSVDFPSDR